MQQSLFTTTGSSDGQTSDARVNAKNQGCVFHGERGSLRIQGQTADGRWIAHRCSRSGADYKPPQVVILPAAWRWLS